MSFRIDQCLEDAHVMAETCRLFAETLDPPQRRDFYSALIPELLEGRKAVVYPREPVGYEPVTAIVREMYPARSH